ncbi:hypothetical protein ACQBAU_04740 [Propionibacteriaceae bacterium Y2011]
MSDAKPSSPSKRSPLKVVLIVVASIVALVLLAVGGLVAYANLRPVNAADYRVAQGDLEGLTLALEPLVNRQSQMLDLSTDPTPEQIEAAGQAQRDQLKAFSDAVDAYGDVRAMKDPEMERLHQRLVTTRDEELAPMVNDFVDNYAAVSTMVKACETFDASLPTQPPGDADRAWFDAQVAACEEAVTAAAASTIFAPLVKVRQDQIAAMRVGYEEYGAAVGKGDLEAETAAQEKIGKAQVGIGTRMARGLEGVSSIAHHTFVAVDIDIAEIDTYCTDKV